MAEAAIPVETVREWIERIREAHGIIWVPARHCAPQAQHDIDIFREMETACIDAERAAVREPT